MSKRKKFSRDYDEQEQQEERRQLATPDGEHPKYDLSKIGPVATECKEPYPSWQGIRTTGCMWPNDGLPSWLRDDE